jgi:hypothetical protein
MPATRFLPVATRAHLFGIVINGAGASEAFIQDPAGEGGATTRKYAWEAGLPVGGGGAGRYRILKRTKAGRVTYFQATHVGDNSYTFATITVPTCGLCAGTGQMLCITCRGTLRIGGGNYFAACNACNQNGWITCTRCGAHPVVVDGKAVDKVLANWG